MIRNIDEIIKRTTKKILKEFSYKEQWEQEKAWFFDGLKSGDFEYDGETVFVEIYKQKDNNDPRFVVYEIGTTSLRDDHFYIQHCKLSEDELKEIAFILKKYNIDVIPIEELVDYNEYIEF